MWLFELNNIKKSRRSKTFSDIRNVKSADREKIGPDNKKYFYLGGLFDVRDNKRGEDQKEAAFR